MEIITIDKDITAMCVTASSFPNGVLAAHQKLHSLIPYSTERKYLGLSRPENGGSIVYHAGAEELESGEAEKLKLETLVIKNGKYASIIIHDYMKNIEAIGEVFTKLTDLPDIDPKGYCVEWYISDEDVQCMVRLSDK